MRSSHDLPPRECPGAIVIARAYLAKHTDQTISYQGVYFVNKIKRLFSKIKRLFSRIKRLFLKINRLLFPENRFPTTPRPFRGGARGGVNQKMSYPIISFYQLIML